MAELAGYSRENAKIILDVVRYLRANGFVVPQNGRGRQFIPPLAPVYVRNDSGVVIPPFACLQTTGTVEEVDQNYIKVVKPVDTTGDAGPYLFNGQEEIAATGEMRYGVAYDGPLCRMRTAGATFASGDKCQPVVGEWHIEAGGDQFTMIGPDDIEENAYRGVIGESGGSGGIIEYKITSLTTKASGPYTGLKAAEAVIHGAPCGRSELIGTIVEVIDHSNELFDEASMVGFTGWASEMVFLSLEAEVACDTLTPCHWAAINRVCTADTGDYAEPCPPPE